MANTSPGEPGKRKTKGGLRQFTAYVRPEVRELLDKGRKPEQSQSEQIKEIIELHFHPHRWCAILPEESSRRLSELNRVLPVPLERDQFLIQIINTWWEGRMRKAADAEAKAEEARHKGATKEAGKSIRRNVPEKSE